MIARCPTRFVLSLLAAVCLQFFAASKTFASLPILTQVLPRGVQRGTEHKLTFVGLRLDDAEDVFFYDDGFRVVDLKVVNSKKVEVTVLVAPECRIGEHMVQLRTRSGVSGYRIVQVEAYPAFQEDEAGNGVREKAQLIEPKAYSDAYPAGVGVVVAGRINNEDHDWYAVDGVAGERLSVEVVGTRLGDFCDSVLELYDPAGKRIARVDDTPFSKQDPFLTLELPAGGRYLIHLTDSAGKGANNAWYRMHVGNFPRPTIAVPSVAKRSELSDITFLGDATGPIKQTIQIDESKLYQDAMHVSDQWGSTPTPVAMRLIDDDVEIVSETEPNNKHDALKREFAVPFSLQGLIGSKGDRDVFRFDAKKGQRLRLEVFGQRIGSLIDTTIRVRGAKNRVLGTSTDTVGLDSRLDLTIPSDGSYVVEVEDARNGGGPMVRYQLDVQAAQRSFSFAIKETQRYTQRRQQVAVPAGNRFAVLLIATRENFGGSFQLKQSQLPEAIHMSARPMPAGATTMPVVFAADPFDKAIDVDPSDEAASDQEMPDESQQESQQESAQALDGQLVEFVAESVAQSENDSLEPVVGRYRNRAQLMRIQPGNMCMKFGVVEKLAVARLVPVPFKVDMVPPSAPISQNGRMNLRINVSRDEGFKAPIVLRLPFRPPGIGGAALVRVKPDQTTVNYPINANPKAAVASWPICVTAVAPNDQGAMISTELHDLMIVTPFVSIEGDMVSAEAGSQVVGKCQLETLKTFQGQAEVRLTPLPEGVTCEPQKFVADEPFVQFPITVGEKCVTGKNHAVKIEVTIKIAGQPIVFNAGRLLLRFSKATKRGKKTSRRQAVKVESSSQVQQ